jgi:hypothetical protein
VKKLRSFVLLLLAATVAARAWSARRARDLSREAVVSAKRAQEPELAALYEADAALREALFGNPAEPVSEPRMLSAFQTAGVFNLWRLWRWPSQVMRYKREPLPMI